MSNKTEYSRLLLKRSTIAFQVPTVPTGSTIDNTWLTTDLLVGEGFLNAFDDKLFYRTLNGIIEVPMSGFSSSNFFTDSAILSGSTLIFNRTDTPAAYSVDLSSIAGSGTTGNFLPLFGGSLTSSAIITNDANDSTFQFNYLGADVILLSTATGITNSFLALDDTSVTLQGFQNASIVSASNQITVNGVTNAIEYVALSGHSFDANNTLTSLDMYNDISMVANGAMSLNSSGFTAGVVGTELQILDNQNGPVGIANVTESAAILLTTQNSTIGQGSYRSAIVGGNNNNIGSGTTSSVIIAGVGNSINNGVINSVVVGGNSLTATENNTLYCQNLSVAGTVSGITATITTLSDTGTTISFTQPTIYNSPTSPATGNITNDLTGSKIGIVQKLYHNDAITPTVPAGWVRLGAGGYAVSVLNNIYAEWVDGTRVEYWITN